MEARALRAHTGAAPGVVRSVGEGVPARCAEGLRYDLHSERVGVGGEAAARRQLQLLGYIARVAQAGAEHEKVVEALSPGAAGQNENERKNAQQTKMTKHVKAPLSFGKR